MEILKQSATFELMYFVSHKMNCYATVNQRDDRFSGILFCYFSVFPSEIATATETNQKPPKQAL